MGFLYTMFVSRRYFDRLGRVLAAVAVAERWLRDIVNVWTVQKKHGRCRGGRSWRFDCTNVTIGRQFFMRLSCYIDHQFCHNVVTVAVDPQGASRVDPQTKSMVTKH